MFLLLKLDMPSLKYKLRSNCKPRTFVVISPKTESGKWIEFTIRRVAGLHGSFFELFGRVRSLQCI